MKRFFCRSWTTKSTSRLILHCETFGRTCCTITGTRNVGTCNRDRVEHPGLRTPDSIVASDVAGMFRQIENVLPKMAPTRFSLATALVALALVVTWSGTPA